MTLAMAISTVLASGDLVTPNMCAQWEPYSFEWWLWGCFAWVSFKALFPIAASSVIAYGAAWLLRRRVE